jgi:hypothetical protein
MLFATFHRVHHIKSSSASINSGAASTRMARRSSFAINRLFLSISWSYRSAFAINQTNILIDWPRSTARPFVVPTLMPSLFFVTHFVIHPKHAASRSSWPEDVVDDAHCKEKAKRVLHCLVSRKEACQRDDPELRLAERLTL